jgi:hypothetical protein
MEVDVTVEEAKGGALGAVAPHRILTSRTHRTMPMSVHNPAQPTLFSCL